MLNRVKLVQGLSLTATSLLLAVGVAAEKKVELSAVPAAVKAVIDQKTAGGATVEEIELETEDGAEVYSVELKSGGKEIELELKPDGTVVSEEAEDDDDDADDKDNEEAEEQEVTPEQVPAAVKSAVEPHLKGATVESWTKEGSEGAIAYEAEYKVENAEHSVKVSEDGSLLEIEKPAASLPAAVTAALKKKYPAANIKTSEAVELHFFEVKVNDGGKNREVKIDASGNVMGSEDGDED